MIEEVLSNLGFEKKEILVYLMLIKTGASTALQIANETRIDRTSVYDVLNRLIDRGIVSLTLKNKTKNFQALKPEDLLMYFKEKYSSLEFILPELNKLNTRDKEPIKCELFQGLNGFKSLIKEIIEIKKDYKVINIKKEFEETLGYFVKQGVIILNESEVRETAIVEKGCRFKKLKNGKYKYLDKKLLSPVTTVIYENKVIFFIWAKPYFAISIGSKVFYEAQEEYFDLLWTIAD